jgi:hypothetical protein
MLSAPISLLFAKPSQAREDNHIINIWREHKDILFKDIDYIQTVNIEDYAGKVWYYKRYVQIDTRQPNWKIEATKAILKQLKDLNKMLRKKSDGKIINIPQDPFCYWFIKDEICTVVISVWIK